MGSVGSDHRPPGFLSDVGRNLLAGLKAAVGYPPRVGAFRVSADQAVVLVLLGVGLTVLLDLARTGDGASLSEFGLGRLGALLLFYLLALYLVARATGPARRWVTLVVMFASAMPVYLLTWHGLQWCWERWQLPDLGYQAIGWGIAAWALMVTLRIVHAGSRRGWTQGIGLTAMLLMVAAVPRLLISDGDIWYQAHDDEPDAPAINVEQVFYAQPDLVNHALDALRDGRPGVVDLYFLGFGGYAFQDVFMREVGNARRVVESQLDGEGRSVSLVNNRKTTAELPIASLSNLRLALRGIATRMDTEEDILLLFLTSHGSNNGPGDHQLAVDFWPLELNTIRPTDLRSALDDAGIRWRVLVISACYSGGFLPALADRNTLVMTAAAPDRESFGCANENEYTFFGRALFAESLMRGPSFIDGFEHARGLIEQWELRDGVSPSRPMMRAGDAIRGQLQRLEHRLTGT